MLGHFHPEGLLGFLPLLLPSAVERCSASLLLGCGVVGSARGGRTFGGVFCSSSNTRGTEGKLLFDGTVWHLKCMAESLKW